MSTDHRVAQADAIARSAPRATLATVALVTGLLAAISRLVIFTLPSLIDLIAEDAWSRLGLSLVVPMFTSGLAGVLALCAVITGLLALRLPVGRARAGAGTALGALVLLESLGQAAFMFDLFSNVGSSPY